jgi:outer membrane PBP1 activator LpoA protein
MSPFLRLISILPAALAIAACADTLPDQDRRITQATPAAKLSVDLLWKDYQADRTAADRKYWGKAVDVSGKVTSVEAAAPRRVMFELQATQGVEARLLDDHAAEILASVVVGERTTLRCFCAGLEGNVILTSCIRP